MQENRLLARLPTETRQRWAPFMRLTAMPAGMEAQAPGAAATQVYFPADAVFARVADSGSPTPSAMAVAIIASDGMVGVSAFLGPLAREHRYEVVVAGAAWRLDMGHLAAEFDARAETRRLLLAYTQTLVTQIAQSAVCARFHPLEERLALRLRQLLEAGAPDRLQTTQDALARLMGTRRERVNEVTGRWERDGLIEQGRGWLRLTDRPRLYGRTCSCFAVLNELAGPKAETHD